MTIVESAGDLEMLDSMAYRVGKEVWLLTEHASFTLPPDNADIAQLPEEFIHSDPEIDEFVASLRSGNAGPRADVTVDHEKREALAWGRQPVDYEGYRQVTKMWEGHTLRWHSKGNKLRALYKGRAVAVINYAEGHGAYEALMAEVDGQLWLCNQHFCFAFPGSIPKNAQHTIVRKGGPVEVLREILARPLPPASEPRADGPRLQIGSAFVPKLQVDMITFSLKVPLTWHAMGHTDPVVGSHGGKPMAIVMPIPVRSPGGSA